MSSLTQKTIKKSINFRGIGLHTGISVSITIHPSKPDTGIVFKRVDLKNNIIIPNVFNVSNASLHNSNKWLWCFSLNNWTFDGALYGLGIDNALIEIDNQEMPILDGSAKFLEEILKIELKQVKSQLRL